MSADALVIGLIGVLLGLLVGNRWLKLKQARSGYTGARSGVAKAKAGLKSARTAWLLALRAAGLAIVLLLVYMIATTTTIFTSAQ